jgi:signal transduction histidine kinase
MTAARIFRFAFRHVAARPESPSSGIGGDQDGARAIQVSPPVLGLTLAALIGTVSVILAAAFLLAVLTPLTPLKQAGGGFVTGLTGYTGFALFAAGSLALAAAVSVWLARTLREGLEAAIRHAQVDAQANAQAHAEAHAQAHEEQIVERERVEQQLVAAKNAAEEASRTKSAFVANMSHELRTPLNAIIGYSEMLQEDAADLGYVQAVPDLEKIQIAGRHLLGLINDILDLSKIEAGKMTLSVEQFDVTTLITDVVGTAQPLVAAHRNQMQLEISSDAGRMRSDSTKLRQVLLNLLSNAAKFTDRGRIVISVAREMREGRDWIVIRVRDTGIGMTAEQASRLFEDFMQADSSTTRRYGGTGLGLAISQRFCRMMGGVITAESEPARGSTFIVSLPVDAPQPEPDNDAPRRAASRGAVAAA